MNFTSHDSFSQKLAAVMLPLFSSSSSTSRDLQDNSWLLWQLAWLYRDTQLVSSIVIEHLKNFLNRVTNQPEPGDRIRLAWMQHVGFPEPEHVQPKGHPHPAQQLRLLLAKIFPETLTPEEQLKRYLTQISGMPESNATQILQWLTSPESRPKKPAKPLLIPVESYAWLNPQAIAALLKGEYETARLLQMNDFHIIALPHLVSRPASLMLTDGSLWLCWPQSDSPNAPHPIVQASLVLHESSHLLRSAELFQTKTSSPEDDSLWKSEDSALRAEWNALEKICSNQPEALKQRFRQRWYEENHCTQMQMLISDWNHFLEDELKPCTASAADLISLPFLSGVYASLAESIYK